MASKAPNVIIDSVLKKIIENKQQPEVFFQQYYMNSLFVIPEEGFFDALYDLGFRVTLMEKQQLIKQLAYKGSQSELELSSILVGRILKMRQLTPAEERNLRELLKEVQTFTIEKKIDLKSQFTKKDKKAQGFLDSVMFGEVMANLQMELSSEDQRLLGNKYDPQDRGVIYYGQFCEDVMESATAIESDLNLLIAEIYQIIRSKFNTFENFFQKYDPTANGHITLKDFSTFLGHFNIYPSYQVTQRLCKIIDPDNKQIAVYIRIRNLLNSMVDKELLGFLQQLTRSLVAQQTTFTQLVEREGAEQGMCNIEKLFEIFNKSGVTIKRPDLTFYLITMQVDRTKDNFIDIHDMRAEMYKQAKRMSISDVYVFKGNINDEKPNKNSNDKVMDKLRYKISFMNNQEIVTLFDITIERDNFMDFKVFSQKIDEIDNSITSIEKRNTFNKLDPNGESKVSAKYFLEILGIKSDEETFKIQQRMQMASMQDKIQGFSPDTFTQMKNLIYTINDAIKKTGKAIGECFRSNKGNFQVSDFKQQLKQLDIYPADFRDEYDNLIKNLCYPSEPDQIDIDKLLRVLAFYSQMKQQNEPAGISPARTVVLWFEKVLSRMIELNLNFDIFTDHFLQGFLRKYQFEQLLFEDLGLEDDGTFNFFYNFLKDDKSGDISILKIQEGIEKERDSRTLFNELVQLVYDQRMDIDRIFRNYDFNSSQEIDIREFERLVRTLQPNVSSSVIEVLFMKFDTNNDQAISLKEFRTRILGTQSTIQSTSSGIESKTLLMQQFIEDLDNMLQEHKTSFELVFNPYDQQGTIKFDDFQNALKMIGFNLEVERTRIHLVMDSLTIHNKQQRLNMKLFKENYIKFKKTSDDGEYLFSKEDMQRVENYANLIEKKLSRANKTFHQMFIQKTKIFDGCFQFDDVKNIITFNLQMDKSLDQRMFLKYIQNSGGKGMVSVEQLEKLIISKKKLASDTFNLIIEFVYKSQELIQEFDLIDVTQSGLISPVELRRIFRKLQGPSLEPEEIRQVAEQFDSLKQGMIDYKNFVMQSRKSFEQSGLSGSDLQKLCSQLKSEFSYRRIDLVRMMKSYDRGDGRVRVAALLQELKSKGVDLNQQQQDLLFTIVKPDETKNIDLYDFATLIDKGTLKGESLNNTQFGYQNIKFTQFKEAEESTKNGKVRVSGKVTAQNIEKIQQAFIKYMNNQSLNIRALFRQLDRDNDEYISFREFKHSLETMFGFTWGVEEFEQIFEKFDTSHSYRLTLDEFELAIMGENKSDFNIKELIKTVRTALLNKTNVSDPTLQLMEAFKSIDLNGDGYVNFQEFQTMMRRAAPSVKLKDAEGLFKYFDRQNEGHFGYEHFLSVLREDHLNLEKIKDAIEPYLRSKNLGLDAFFDKFANRHGIMSMENLKEMMDAIEFPLDENQLEDLFEFLDSEKDNRITKSEFKSIIVNQSIDFKTLFKKIRRLCIKHSLDLEIQLESKDERKTGQISQYSFNRLMRPFTAFIHPYEMELLFRYFDPKGNKVINYKDFLAKVQEITFDITSIIDSIKESLKGYNISEQQLFNSFDQNKDGQINMAEFDAMLQSLTIMLAEEELWECFESFDLNSTGDITLLEFSQVIKQSKISKEASIHLLLNSKNYNRTQIEKQELSAKFNISKPARRTVNFQEQNITEVESGGIFEVEKPKTKLPDSVEQLKINKVLTQFQVDQLVRVVQTFVARRKRTMQELVLYYFPQSEPIDEQQYVELTKQLECGLQEKEMRDLFYYMDTYVMGLITVEQFKKVFMTQQYQEEQQQSQKTQQEKQSAQQKVSTQKTKQQQDEKKSAKIVPLAEPQKRKKILANQTQLDQLVKTVKAFVVRKKRTIDDLIAFFFPPGGASHLDERGFVGLCMKLNCDLKEVQAQELFYHLDVNGGGQVSINEFQLVFPPENKKVQIKNEQMIQTLDEEISELFDKVDDNKNGYLDQTEMHKALVAIGINPSRDELQNYFTLIDKNKDNTISKEEFVEIFKDFIKKELNNINNLISDLRSEFKKADVTNQRALRPNQIKVVFKNLGIAIPDEDVETLFKEIDVDKSGLIDIDEFIAFMQKSQSGMTARVSNILMNIRGTQKISLKDLRGVFESLPSNFTNSFCRQLSKNGQNLSSKYFKPKLDPSGLFYQDIIYLKNLDLNLTQSVLEKQGNIPKTVLEIQLVVIEGIPTPDAKDVPPDSYLKREVALVLLDRIKNTFFGNMVYLEATCDPNQPNKWTFDGGKIFLKYNNFDERKDDHIDLVIETIAYIKHQNRLIEVSCCHSQVSLMTIIKGNGKLIAELHGGAPNRILSIDKKDVKTNQYGWRSMLQALGSSVQSVLRYEIKKITNQIIIKDLSVFPDKMILDQTWFNYIKSFREYFAYRSVQSGDVDCSLHNNTSIKALTAILDIPQTNKQIIQFWNIKIQPKINNFQTMYNIMNHLGNNLYLLLNSLEFKYNRADPTQQIFEYNKRQDILEVTLNEVIGFFEGSKQKKTPLMLNYEPISTVELMDDEDQDELAQLDKFIIKKKKKVG